MITEPVLTLKTARPDVDQAFRIALGDIAGNVAPFHDGLLDTPAPVILAGLDYDTPWTRDAAINVWNGAGLLAPAVSRNTLLSVLRRDGNGGNAIRVGGQYWDAIIWVTGAWAYYLYTGDREMLALAHEATLNSLAYFEATEFDADTGLFRGAAVYGDGVAAYPDRYATGGYGGIDHWAEHNPDKKHPVGEGVPMQTLSTNCVYYSAYLLANRMAAELGRPRDEQLANKAASLRKAINEKLWMAAAGRYRYFIDPWGGSDEQEGMGLSLAILLGAADEQRAAAIFDSAHVTPAGFPCVWPTYPRYQKDDPSAIGRHSGTVWPHIQGFWGCAAAAHGRTNLFAHELNCLTAHASRDAQFTEIYHPETHLPYGGVQECSREEDPSGLFRWHSCRRQTWSATAYVRLVLMGLLGMRFDETGLSFAPCVPEGFGEIRLTGLTWRDTVLDITLAGTGRRVESLTLGDAPVERIPAALVGTHSVCVYTG